MEVPTCVALKVGLESARISIKIGLLPGTGSAAVKVVLRLHSTPKPADFTAIALRWLALPHRFEMRHRLALFGQL